MPSLTQASEYSYDVLSTSANRGAVKADKASDRRKSKYVENLGTIEVVVLRCQAENEDPPRLLPDRVRELQETPRRRDQEPSVRKTKEPSVREGVSEIGGLFGLFDGASESSVDESADQAERSRADDTQLHDPPGLVWDSRIGEFRPIFQHPGPSERDRLQQAFTQGNDGYSTNASRGQDFTNQPRLGQNDENHDANHLPEHQIGSVQQPRRRDIDSLLTHFRAVLDSLSPYPYDLNEAGALEFREDIDIYKTILRRFQTHNSEEYATRIHDLPQVAALEDALVTFRQQYDANGSQIGESDSTQEQADITRNASQVFYDGGNDEHPRKRSGRRRSSERRRSTPHAQGWEQVNQGTAAFAQGGPYPAWSPSTVPYGYRGPVQVVQPGNYPKVHFDDTRPIPVQMTREEYERLTRADRALKNSQQQSQKKARKKSVDRSGSRSPVPELVLERVPKMTLEEEYAKGYRSPGFNAMLKEEEAKERSASKESSGSKKSESRKSSFNSSLGFGQADGDANQPGGWPTRPWGQDSPLPLGWGNAALAYSGPDTPGWGNAYPFAQSPQARGGGGGGAVELFSSPRPMDWDKADDICWGSPSTNPTKGYTDHGKAAPAKRSGSKKRSKKEDKKDDRDNDWGANAGWAQPDDQKPARDDTARPTKDKSRGAERKDDSKKDNGFRKSDSGEKQFVGGWGDGQDADWAKAGSKAQSTQTSDRDSKKSSKTGSNRGWENARDANHGDNEWDKGNGNNGGWSDRGDNTAPGWPATDNAGAGDSNGWANAFQTKNKTASSVGGDQKGQNNVSQRRSKEDVNSKDHIKSYWDDWNKTPIDDDGHAGAGNREPRRDAYKYPAMSRPAVPSNEAKDRSHGVQAGKGAEYAHKTRRPVYLDSMAEPYAVFTFKYRSRKVLEKILGAKVAEVDYGRIEMEMEQQVLKQQFSKDELAAMVAREREQHRERRDRNERHEHQYTAGSTMKKSNGGKGGGGGEWGGGNGGGNNERETTGAVDVNW